jgi:hypothetical protein
MTTLNGQRALITGASSGIGADFAKHFAALGCHLVLVARREDRLTALAAELRAAHGVSIDVIALDLSQPDAAQTLFDRLKAANLQVDILVNNAGFGVYGRFDGQDWARNAEMIALNITALTQLTHLYVKDMKARNHGYILNVASIGGYTPTPLYATYAATKSYVLDFSDAVAYELRGTDVSVTTVSPGVTRTEFFAASGQSLTLFQRVTMMESPVVVKQAVDAMLKRRRSFVSGRLNALLVWMLRFSPRFVQLPVAQWMMK